MLFIIADKKADLDLTAMTRENRTATKTINRVPKKLMQCTSNYKLNALWNVKKWELNWEFHYENSFCSIQIICDEGCCWWMILNGKGRGSTVALAILILNEIHFARAIHSISYSIIGLACDISMINNIVTSQWNEDKRHLHRHKLDKYIFILWSSNKYAEWRFRWVHLD